MKIEKRTIRKLIRRKTAMLGVIIILLLIILGVASPLVAPTAKKSGDIEASRRFLKPLNGALCGTDNLGRDIFGRLAHGARVSLGIGVSAVAFSLLAGILLGAVAGYYGGWVDMVFGRIIDIMMSFPTLLLALAIMAAFGRTTLNVVLAVGIVKMPIFARQVRASVLSVKEFDYVTASRALGAGNLSLLYGRILPNCVSPLVVLATLGVGTAILEVAGLSFLGLGVSPGTAEWGLMINEGREFIMSYPWIVLFPGAAIALAVFAFNLFGDGLRDALDPKLV